MGEGSGWGGGPHVWPTNVDVWQKPLQYYNYPPIKKKKKQLGIKLPYDPAIPLLDIYPEKTTVQKDICIPVFIAALVTIARTQKQPRCPLTVEWIKKIWYIHK